MDPILALADFDHAAPFTLAGKPGKVIPQHLAAGSTHYHSRFFYVEFPADGGNVYQIDASHLVRVIGDGGVTRHFNAAAVARVIGGLSAKIDHHALLKTVSL
jgi:hypothetical protein